MDKIVESFSPTKRSRVRLLRERGRYDREMVYKILDAALLCNVGYIIDDQPYVTPTTFWREGNHLYWHGSSASRALVAQADGIPVCLTVSHVDGLVVARSGFHSSVNYRSVMAFGRASLIQGRQEKHRAMDVFVNRFVTGRTDANRPVKDSELDAIKLLSMDLEEASAKIRVGPPVDDEEDYLLPVWAGVIGFKTVVETILPDPRNPAGVEVPPGVAVYQEGKSLDDVLSSIYDGDNPNG